MEDRASSCSRSATPSRPVTTCVENVGNILLFAATGLTRVCKPEGIIWSLCYHSSSMREGLPSDMSQLLWSHLQHQLTFDKAIHFMDHTPFRSHGLYTATKHDACCCSTEDKVRRTPFELFITFRNYPTSNKFGIGQGRVLGYLAS